MKIKEYRDLPDRERARIAIAFSLLNNIDLDDPRELTDEEIERLDLEQIEAFWAAYARRVSRRHEHIRELKG